MRRGWHDRMYPLLHMACYWGLRHGTATMLLAAGEPIKMISEILGHSTSAFTVDVYTEVAEELAESAAAAIAAFVPRRASNVPAGGEDDH